jgi:hypothetical protein
MEDRNVLPQLNTVGNWHVRTLFLERSLGFCPGRFTRGAYKLPPRPDQRQAGEIVMEYEYAQFRCGDSDTPPLTSYSSVRYLSVLFAWLPYAPYPYEP